MTIRIGTGFGPVEPQSYHIEFWYDRRQRYWVVQVFDDQDRQHASECCPDKGWRDSTIDGYKEQYSTQDVRKV